MDRSTEQSTKLVAGHAGGTRALDQSHRAGQCVARCWRPCAIVAFETCRSTRSLGHQTPAAAWAAEERCGAAITRLEIYPEERDERYAPFLARSARHRRPEGLSRAMSLASGSSRARPHP